MHGRPWLQGFTHTVAPERGNTKLVFTWPVVRVSGLGRVREKERERERDRDPPAVELSYPIVDLCVYQLDAFARELGRFAPQGDRRLVASGGHCHQQPRRDRRTYACSTRRATFPAPSTLGEGHL